MPGKPFCRLIGKENVRNLHTGRNRLTEDLLQIFLRFTNILAADLAEIYPV